LKLFFHSRERSIFIVLPVLKTGMKDAKSGKWFSRKPRRNSMAQKFFVIALAIYDG